MRKSREEEPIFFNNMLAACTTTVGGQPSNNTMGQYTTLNTTLLELVDSGRLSENVFLSDEDEENDTFSGFSIHDSKKSLHLLNAVKLSLLLTKEFARCCSSEGGDSISSFLSAKLEHVNVTLSSRPAQNNGAYHDHDIRELKQNENSDADRPIAVEDSKAWDILCVSVQCPQVSQVPSINVVSQEKIIPNCSIGPIPVIRHLGELIYSLFSLKKEFPLPKKSETLIENDSDSDGLNENDQSRSKRRGVGVGVVESSSLFSNLVETGDYPTSVCRLISDMFDSAESPFNSLEEVIDDLEQMEKLPHIFLHDDEIKYFKLVFGQRYYGQEREISQLLAISTGLEQSAGGGDAELSIIHSSSFPKAAEVVFVKGMAGVGKTHLVQRASDFLSSLGYWIVAKTKFERGAEHGSRQCISSLFDKLVTTIVRMRDGQNQADAEYAHGVFKAILGAIEQSSISALTGFIPSIVDLIPGADRKSPGLAEGNLKSWQLTYLLSKLMGAILSLDRFVMLCLDDLQWCDPAMLALISEIIIHSGNNRWRCLCVGTYRSNEVSGIHPLMTHYNILKASKHVNVSDIQLLSLTKNDVIEMVMTEMRLPRRVVAYLGEVIHKKTSGHAIFVVEMLNSLVRDSTIAYSPRKLRYDFDQNQLSSLKTWESVASLIVSNLSSLSNEDLQNLQILCCFGMQSHAPIIHLTEGCPEVQSRGMSSSLDKFVEDGILDRSGSLVSFTHDLIHETIYENMMTVHRQHIQLNIGIFLGVKAALDETDGDLTIESSIEKLHLSKKKQDKTASISLVAVDLINSAGPEYIKDETQRIRFARWNLQAASESKVKSNFKSSLHYCKRGISFLREDLWSESSSELCLKLHEDAAFASYATGNTAETAQLAKEITEHVTLEESLFAQLMILRALEAGEEHQHIIARGLAILRTLKFEIPSNITPLIVMTTLIETGNAANQFSTEKIINMQKTAVVDSTKRNILNFVGVVSMACYQTASPYYPLIICATVNYSLKNGICEESAMAFALLGYFQIYLQGNYESAKHWGNVAEKILDNSLRKDHRAALTLNGFLFLWFKPFGELADRLFDLFERSLTAGNLDGAMYALCQYWRVSFYGGQKLAVLSLSYEKFMPLMVKYSYAIVKFCVLDISLTMELIGSSDDPYSYFEGAILSESELLQDAKAKKNNQQLQSLALKQFFSAFYFGDYSNAANLSKEALSFPTSKTPKIQMIFHYFYHGLTSFYLHRVGEGESHLDQGKDMLEKFTVWHKHSQPTFENKLFLLQAEYFASLCNRDAAIEKYEASIRVARDNGFVHEQGLAHEFMGHYLASIVEMAESMESYKQAYKLNMQWGAVAKANQLLEDHNLGIPGGDIGHSSSKHSRDW